MDSPVGFPIVKLMLKDGAPDWLVATPGIPTAAMPLPKQRTSRRTRGAGQRSNPDVNVVEWWKIYPPVKNGSGKSPNYRRSSWIWKWITLLRATPKVTLIWHGFLHLIWKYAWHVFSGILSGIHFWHSIWHLFWHPFGYISILTFLRHSIWHSFWQM